MSHAQTSSRTGARVLFVLVLLVMVVLAAVAWLTWRGLQARDDLTAAADALTQARTAALDGDLDHARLQLAQAQVETASARDKTSDPVWLLAGALPVVGDTPHAVTAVARQADALADDVFPQLLAIAQSVEPGALLAGDQIDVDALRRIAPTVANVQSDLRSVRSALAAASDGFVIAPVADALADFRAQVDDVAGTVDTVARATELLNELSGT